MHARHAASCATPPSICQPSIHFCFKRRLFKKSSLSLQGCCWPWPPKRSSPKVSLAVGLCIVLSSSSSSHHHRHLIVVISSSSSHLVSSLSCLVLVSSRRCCLISSLLSLACGLWLVVVIVLLSSSHHHYCLVISLSSHHQYPVPCRLVFLSSPINFVNDLHMEYKGMIT